MQVYSSRRLQRRNRPLSYYSRNDFKFLFSTEEQEGKNTGIPEGEKLKTRLMYFDLIQLCIKDKAD